MCRSTCVSIMDYLKKKVIVTINSTPSASVVLRYEALLNSQFIVGDKNFRVSRYYPIDSTPSVRTFALLNNIL